MVRLQRKRALLWMLGVSLLLTAGLKAVEIDPKEEPLIQVTFPLDSNAQRDGLHEEIIYVLYQSGIGRSFRKIGNARDDAALGSNRDEYTFWLRPSMIQEVVSKARTYSASKEIPPRDQQFIIEGSAIPDKVIASWCSSQPGASVLPLIQLMDHRMRDDLLLHFRQLRSD